MHEIVLMSPCWGNTYLFYSSQQLPRLKLGPLKGWHGALEGPLTYFCNASGAADAEIQGHSQMR